ncbi:ATP-binding protein [Ottowia sp.]|uniref:ATP-binding protein n=1 Tax=Ottowia sp. TaxID=1898956 RepID=UPI0025D4AE4E|nr:ATP-binding protein [Ottowia sp.]MBK6616244.1 sensor histidine kinase [Ottowia sp.]
MTEKQVVALRFDLDALKHSMRFAFASDVTVVQELIQNARRAGATKVWVSTGTSDSGEGVMTVADNGSGIDDFQVLLHVATSGWNEDTKKTEGPYGMGFLSAVYGAKHVEVVSRGKVLRMEQELVLANGQFEVEDFDGSLADSAVTAVTMRGVNVAKIASSIESMVQGYPIDVVLNGRVLKRPDALDGSYRKVGVGHIKRSNTQYAKGGARVYLQGFRVNRDASRYDGGSTDVVHLDSTMFHGKFPDRDVVINQADMLALVDADVRAMYVKSLLEAKKRLEPAAFMEAYQALADSLGMLEVFNDLDVVPKCFLQEVVSMPHDTEYREFLALGKEGEFFTRAELETGRIVIGDLEPYTSEDDTDNTRRWVFAFAAGAWMIKYGMLDEQHWLHGLVKLHEESDVTLEAVGEYVRGPVDSRRLHCISGVEIVLCAGFKVGMGETSFILSGAVLNEGESNLYVPVLDGSPAYVGEDVIQQFSSYRWDDEFHEDERDQDEAALNQMVRELASDSPEEELAMSIEAAIASYSKVRSLECTIKVTAEGKVEVLSMKQDG